MTSTIDPNSLHCRADQSKCRGESYCYCDCWSCKQARELATAAYDERVRKIALDALVNAVSEEIITAVTDNENLHRVLDEPFRKVLTEMVLEERATCAKIAESGGCGCLLAPCAHDEAGKRIAGLIRAQKTP